MEEGKVRRVGAEVRAGLQGSPVGTSASGYCQGPDEDKATWPPTALPASRFGARDGVLRRRWGGSLLLRNDSPAPARGE